MFAQICYDIIRLHCKGAAVFAIGLGDGMMQLFAKLTALSVIDNMYLASLPEEISAHTEDIRSKICFQGPEQIKEFATTWSAPEVMHLNYIAWTHIGLQFFNGNAFEIVAIPIFLHTLYFSEPKLIVHNF